MNMEETNNFRLQDWESLHVIVNKVYGEKGNDSQLTCFDVNKWSILFGSSTGKLHHYSRLSKNIYSYHLKSPVTCIKLSPDGNTAAIGLHSGVINLAELTKPNKCGSESEAKLIELHLHSTAISCLLWISEFIVYIGDENGNLGCVQFNDQLVVENAQIVWMFEFFIVQLCSISNWLLVSTLKNVYVSSLIDGSVNFTEIGSKPRKLSGEYGVCIGINAMEDYIIYTSRPGHRIWVANFDGRVIKTLLFKNFLKKSVCKMFDFGYLATYNVKNLTKYILVYSKDGLGVIDPYRGVLVKIVEIPGLQQLAIFDNYIYILLKSSQMYFISIVDLVNDRDFLEQTITTGVQKFSVMTEKMLNAKLLPRQYEDIMEKIAPFYDILPQNIQSNQTCLQELDPALVPNTEENKKFAKISLEEFDSGIVVKEKKPEAPKSSTDHIIQDDIDFTLLPKCSDDLDKEVEAKEIILNKILALDSVFGDKSETAATPQPKQTFDNFGADTFDEPILEYNLDLTSDAGVKNDSPLHLDDVYTTSNENAIKSNNYMGIEPDVQKCVSIYQPLEVTIESSYLPDNSPNVSKSPVLENFLTEPVDTLEENSDNVKVETCNVQKNITESWVEIVSPGVEPVSVLYLAACDNYLCCIDTDSFVWLAELQNNELISYWKKLQGKAHKISMSPCGTLVWKVYNNTAYALKNPCPFALSGDEWVESAKHVDLIAVGDDCVWYTSVAGSLFVQIDLNKSQPSSYPHSILLPPEDKIISLSCFHGIVWVLSCSGAIFVRVGITKSNPAGTEWTALLSAPSISLSLCIGSHDTSLIIDSYKKLYFFTGVEPSYPRGISDKKWEVVPSKNMFLDQKVPTNAPYHDGLSIIMNSCVPLIVSNSHGYFLSNIGSKVIHQSSPMLHGHLWKTFPVGNIPTTHRWSLLSCQSLTNSKGAGWLVGPEGSLYCFNRKGKICQKIALPSGDVALALASAPGCLWMLTSNSFIYARVGIGSSNISGSNWMKLDTVQIKGAPLSSLSVNKEVAWCCDANGLVYMTVGNISNPQYNGLSPAWITVETVLPQTDFCKVVVSPSSDIIWALDTRRNIYTRKGASPNLPIGTKWVKVEGKKAVDITLSSTTAYILTASGDIYSHPGMFSSKHTTAWVKIPGVMSQLSVSHDDILWGLDKRGWLAIHEKLPIGDLKKCQLNGKKEFCDSSSDSSDDSWHLVSLDSCEL